MFVSVTAPDGTAAEREIPLLTAEYPAGAEQTVTLYVPNETGDGLDTVQVSITLSPQGILDALIAQGALPDGVQVNQMSQDGASLALDLNGAFAEAVSATGTTGEAMLVGSVVNSFLSAYGAETVTLTCDGAVLETGHTIYDEPLSLMSILSE